MRCLGVWSSYRPYYTSCLSVRLSDRHVLAPNSKSKRLKTKIRVDISSPRQSLTGMSIFSFKGQSARSPEVINLKDMENDDELSWHMPCCDLIYYRRLRLSLSGRTTAYRAGTRAEISCWTAPHWLWSDAVQRIKQVDPANTSVLITFNCFWH